MIPQLKRVCTNFLAVFPLLFFMLPNLSIESGGRHEKEKKKEKERKEQEM